MKILFIGCGNMGSAIVKGMITSQHFEQSDVDVLLPSDSPHVELVQKELGLKIHFDTFPVDHVFDMILFAVKPQTLAEVLPEYKEYQIPSSTLIASIAAGKSIHFFENSFPNNPIIRIMPNINVLVNYGATGAVHNTRCTEEHMRLIESIFSTIGTFHWLAKEDDIDTIIALSGSSPAYYFLFTEYLVKCAIAKGIDPATALDMALATFIGCAKNLEHSGKSLEELRAAVTSHKGTTQAALDAFNESDALSGLIGKAFDAAIKRSQELAHSN